MKTEEDAKIKLTIPLLEEAGFSRNNLDFEHSTEDGKRPDIVGPWFIAENKKPGTDISAKDVVKQACKYARSKKFAKDVAYTTDGHNILAWNPKNEKPWIFDRKQINYFMSKLLENGGETPPEKAPPTKKELLTLFKWANNLLRDKEGLSHFKRFTESADLLFIKLFTSRDNSPDENGKRPRPRYMEWERIVEEDDADLLYDLITGQIWDYLTKNYGKVFDGNTLEIKNAATVKEIIQELDKYDFENTDTDIKGECFEYFLSDVMAGGGLGQFFTPRCVVNQMVGLVNLKTGEKVYDPACGTGGFLITAFKKMLSMTSENGVQEIRRHCFFGQEFSEDTARIAKMNMILAGDGHNNLSISDTLLKKPEAKYDVILANPPFGLSHDTPDWAPVKSKKGENLFIQHIALSLKKNGRAAGKVGNLTRTSGSARAAVVIPDGILFGTNHKKLRKWLIENYNLTQVISLPADTFAPYANVKTSILCLSVGSTKEVDLWGKKLSKKETVAADYSLHLGEYDKVRTKGIKKIGELFNIEIGTFNSSARDDTGAVPFYSGHATNPVGTHSIYNVEGPCIVFVKGGGSPKNPYGKQVGLGKAFYVEGKAAISNGCYILKAKIEELSLPLVVIWINNNKKIFVDLASSTTSLGNIKKSSLENVGIPIPSKIEQDNIVAEYEKLEKEKTALLSSVIKIEEKQNNLENLSSIEYYNLDLDNRFIEHIGKDIWTHTIIKENNIYSAYERFQAEYFLSGVNILKYPYYQKQTLGSKEKYEQWKKDNNYTSKDKD